MGFQPSPYVTVQNIAWLEDAIKGDRLDINIVFRWDVLVLNLPGITHFDPSRPWVFKLRSEDERIAAAFFSTSMMLGPWTN
jgi:hypothetical protein